MNSTLKNRLPSIPVILLSLLIGVIGISCGGGGGGGTPPPPADEEANGIYSGTGSGTFTGVNAEKAMTLNKVKGISDGTRFMFFNAEPDNADLNVLYDGTITSISKTDLVATADVYQGGKIVAIGVAVTGTVNSRSRIQLTFAASGDFLGGSIDADFNTLYDRGATQQRIYAGAIGSWTSGRLYMVIPLMRGVDFSSYADNTMSVTASTPAATNSCYIDGTFGIPDATVNLYEIVDNLVLSNPVCTDVGETTGYTGFATIVDVVSTDDTVWYAVTNGTFSIYAVLER